MQNGGPEAGWCGQSVWVCRAASRMWPEHGSVLQLWRPVAAPQEWAEPLQSDGVNLSLLLKDALQLKCTCPPSRSLVAAAQRQLRSVARRLLWVYSQIHKNSREETRRRPRHLIAVNSP